MTTYFSEIQYAPVLQNSLEQAPRALGSSGRIWCTGLTLTNTAQSGQTPNPKGCLRLRPLSFRGKESPSCFIDIQLEKKVLRQLIQELERVEAGLL